MEADTQTTTYQVKSKDDELFTISPHAAKLSGLLAMYIQDGMPPPFPVEMVYSKTLACIVQYLEQHAKTDLSPEELAEFDRNVVDGDDNLKFTLLLAGNFMQVDSLVRLVADAVADSMRGKTVEELRVAYKVTDDFTAEEKEQMRNEERWVENR